MLKASNILQRVFNAHILTFWLRRCGLLFSKILRSTILERGAVEAYLGKSSESFFEPCAVPYRTKAIKDFRDFSQKS